MKIDTRAIENEIEKVFDDLGLPAKNKKIVDQILAGDSIEVASGEKSKQYAQNVFSLTARGGRMSSVFTDRMQTRGVAGLVRFLQVILLPRKTSLDGIKGL